MQLNDIIEHLRISKNLSVKDLCQDRLSKASYSRFVQGKTMISAEILLFFLTKFKMTFAMFMQEHMDYFQLKYDYTTLNHSLTLKQAHNISRLINEYQKKEELNKSEAIFLKVCQLLEADMTDKKLNQQLLEQVQAYFTQLEAWNDYDYKAMKNLMDLLPVDFVADRLFHSMDNVDDLADPLLPEELFYNLCQLYLRLLKEKETTAALEVYQLLEQFHIDQQDIGRKIYRAYNHGLYLSIYHDLNSGRDKLEQVIKYMQDLMMGKRVDEFLDNYQVIQDVYELADLSLEEDWDYDND